MQNTNRAQIEKYGGVEGYRKEMKRRRAMRKTYGTGGFKDPAVIEKALSKRWGKKITLKKKDDIGEYSFDRTSD